MRYALMIIIAGVVSSCQTIKPNLTPPDPPIQQTWNDFQWDNCYPDESPQENPQRFLLYYGIYEKLEMDYQIGKNESKNIVIISTIASNVNLPPLFIKSAGEAIKIQAKQTFDCLFKDNYRYKILEREDISDVLAEIFLSKTLVLKEELDEVNLENATHIMPIRLYADGNTGEWAAQMKFIDVKTGEIISSGFFEGKVNR